jgi:hypothetical protein
MYTYIGYDICGSDNGAQCCTFFLVVKGTAADATDALQPWGFLCNPVMKIIIIIIIIICPFPSNGALVEWNWQGKTEERGAKTCPSATLSSTNPTWTDPGSNPGLRSGRPAANRLSHGTALCVVLRGSDL